MSILTGFDASNFEAAPSTYEPLAEGWYDAIIIDTEEKQTKAGTGSYLQLQYEITSEPGKGRYVFDRLNLVNPNPKAVEIAQEMLARICHAVGVMQPKQPEELMAKPVSILVGVRPGDGQYGPQNVVKAVRAAGDVPKPKPAPKLSEPSDDLPF